MQDFTAFISSCSYHLRTRITTDKKSATEMLMTAFNSMIAVPSQCNYTAKLMLGFAKVYN